MTFMKALLALTLMAVVLNACTKSDFGKKTSDDGSYY